MRSNLEVCPISFPNTREDTLDFHESERLYDIIRMEIAIMTAVSNSVNAAKERASRRRRNMRVTKQFPSPNGIEGSVYVNGVPMEIKVSAQRKRNTPLMRRESW